MTRRQEFVLWLRRSSPAALLFGIAFVILAGSAIIGNYAQAQDRQNLTREVGDLRADNDALFADNRALRLELECRAEINGQVSVATGKVLRSFLVGLLIAVTDGRDELDEVALEATVALDGFDEAAERQAAIATICGRD